MKSPAFESSLFLIASRALLAASQTLYMVGDSTMAAGGGGSGTNGWGQYIGQYISLPVVNDAVAGTSARSYTESGRFTTLYGSVKKGDFVVIEFGHNDGTSSPDNGRSDAVGDGYNTVSTVTNSAGVTDVIHTFDYYITNAVKNLTAKGAIPIVSSQTPDNIWPMSLIGGRFQTYAQEVGSSTGITYVDHGGYTAQAYIALGETTVNTYYPIDHTHTSPTGANVVAEAFVRGLLCGTSTLTSHVNSSGKNVPNGCLNGASPPPTTTSATTTKPAGTTTTSASSASQSKYAQCGGTGYTGPKVCASGSTCTYSNPYYSQCL